MHGVQKRVRGREEEEGLFRPTTHLQIVRYIYTYIWGQGRDNRCVCEDRNPVPVCKKGKVCVGQRQRGRNVNVCVCREGRVVKKGASEK